MPEEECREELEPPSRKVWDVSEALWKDWHWQLKNRITDLSGLEKFIRLSDSERKAMDEANLPISITPYYLSLLNGEFDDPIRKCVIPIRDELDTTRNEDVDPLHEDVQMPVPCLVHRYPDRVLFLTTGFCSVNCRYCCRSRMVGQKGTTAEYWDQAIDYIASNKKIRDVVVSGGDPLTLSNLSIEKLLKSLYNIPHIEMVRIGTKVPMVMPMRIDRDLADILRKFKPLYMSVHATHPNELTKEACGALDILADAGVVLGSQTVLLKGVNDSVEVMSTLMKKLLKNRVRPYYLYRCDKVVGSEHFRTTIQAGKDIIRQMRGYMSGYGIPHYIVDSCEGKMPVLPEYLLSDENGIAVFRSYQGVEVKV